MENTDRLALMAQIASSYLRRNSVPVDQIATVMRNAAEALAEAERQLGRPPESGAGITPKEPAKEQAEPPAPAVPIDEAVQRDYLVCLEDGQQARTLKRHLQSAHATTPQQYRAKWGLPRDYPMSAPAYSESRSALAKARGLGRKPAAPPARAAARTRPARAAATKKPRRGRSER